MPPRPMARCGVIAQINRCCNPCCPINVAKIEEFKAEWPDGRPDPTGECHRPPDVFTKRDVIEFSRPRDYQVRCGRSSHSLVSTAISCPCSSEPPCRWERG